jgi:diacylglycerol kinase (ATP)
VGQRVVLAVNPTAGSGRGVAAAKAAADRLRARGLEVSEVAGRDAADAMAQVRTALATEPAALVAVGGDGMVHLAIQAVAGTAVPLGIVPTGTGNDFARTLGLPLRDPARAGLLAADLLLENESRAVDAVRAADKWFGCVLGAGFDSRVNDRANRLRWPRGRLRYDLAILAELSVFRPLPFTIEMDGTVHQTEAMLVAVGNAKSYGAGMRVTPNAEVDDGLLDVTVLGPVSKPDFLRTFPRVYRGTHLTHPAVKSYRARSVRLESAGVNAYADGEFLAELPVECVCVPGALRVLAP